MKSKSLYYHIKDRNWKYGLIHNDLSLNTGNEGNALWDFIVFYLLLNFHLILNFYFIILTDWMVWQTSSLDQNDFRKKFQLVKQDLSQGQDSSPDSSLPIT